MARRLNQGAGPVELREVGHSLGGVSSGWKTTGTRLAKLFSLRVLKIQLLSELVACDELLFVGVLHLMLFLLSNYK